MTFLVTVLAFIVTLAILIVVHELGHYGAARLCGVKVLRFSVGFGRAVFKKTYGPDRTEWVVGALPLGGYVRMLDERDEDQGPIAAADRLRAFNQKNVWARSFIVLAGPLANFVLAVAVYWLLAVLGTNEPKAVLAAPQVHSAAARAGIYAGDVVTVFNGADIRSMNQLRWELLKSATQPGAYDMQVRSASGSVREIVLTLQPEDLPSLEGDVMGDLGFVPDSGPARVRRVLPDLPGAQAGLREGDEWIAIDGGSVHNAQDVIAQVRAHPDRAMSVQIMREGRPQTLSITPTSQTNEQGQRIGRIGIEFASGPWVEVRYGPFEAAAHALIRTWDMAVFSLRMLVRMVSGEVSWKNLSGPVTVADYAGQTARIGWAPYLSFLALISIGLGVLNLLPIPLLDGGHLLYHAAEIFTGRPPAQWLLEWGQRIGAVALLMLTALALYNDLSRLFS